MKIGDRVEWKSQAGGVYLVKRGTIVGVVPPGVDPTKIVEKILMQGDSLAQKYKLDHEPGGYRQEESYLVAHVTQFRTDSAGRITEKKLNPLVTYWPRRSLLTPVQEVIEKKAA
jgi:hypothetical protein